MFLNHVNSSLDCKKEFTYSQVESNKKNYSICRFCPNGWNNCLAKKNIKIIFNKTINDDNEGDYMIVNNLRELEELLTFFQQNFQFFYMMNTFYVEEISFTLIFENNFNYFSFMENIVLQFTTDLFFFCKEVKMIFLGNTSNSNISSPTIFIYKSFIKFKGFSSISFINLTLIIDDTNLTNSDNFGIQIDSVSYLELIRCKIFYVLSQSFRKKLFPYFAFGKDESPVNQLRLDYVEIKINIIIEEEYSSKEKAFIYINAIKLEVHELCIFDSFLSNFPSIIQFDFNFERTQFIILQSLTVYNSRFLYSKFITFLNQNLNFFPHVIFDFLALVNFSMTNSTLLEIYDTMEFQINELTFRNLNHINSSIFKIINKNFEQYKLNVQISKFIASFSYFDTYLIFPKTYIINVTNLYLNSNTFLCFFDEIYDFGYGSFFRIPSKYDGGFVYLRKNIFTCPKDSFLYLFEKIAQEIIENSTFIFEDQRNISLIYINLYLLGSTITKCKFLDFTSNSDRLIVEYIISENLLEISFCDFIGFYINTHKIYVPIMEGRDILLFCLKFIYFYNFEISDEMASFIVIRSLSTDSSYKNQYKVTLSNSSLLNFKLFSQFQFIINAEIQNAYVNLTNLLFKNIYLDLKFIIIYAICLSLVIENVDISDIYQTNANQQTGFGSAFFFYFQLLKFKMTKAHFNNFYFSGNIVKIEGLSGDLSIIIDNSTFLNIINNFSSILFSSSSDLFYMDGTLSFMKIKFKKCIFENSNVSFGGGGGISIYDSKNIDIIECRFRNYLVPGHFLLYISNSIINLNNCSFLFYSISFNISSLIYVKSSWLTIGYVYFYGISLLSKLSYLINAAVSKINIDNTMVDYLNFFQTAFNVKYSEFLCFSLVLMNVKIISLQANDSLNLQSNVFDFGSESIIEFNRSIFLNIMIQGSSIANMINAERCVWLFENIFIWKFEGSSLISLSLSGSPKNEEGLDEYNKIENNNFYDIKGNENGGCLSINQASCIVNQNLFSSCISSQGKGGGIFLIGNIDNIVSITNNTFINNFAVVGGAIHYSIFYKTKFKEENNFTNSSSLYSFGKAIYSFPRKLILYNNSEMLDLTHRNLYPIKNFRSGDSFENLSLATYSEEDELIIPTPLNTFFIKLTFPDNSYKTISQNEMGYFNISDFPIYSQPNSIINLNLSADFVYRENELHLRNYIKITFSVEFRFCLIGEIFNIKTNLACAPCEAVKYSYDSYEDDCRKCPYGADCSLKMNGIFYINPGKNIL